MIPSRPLVSVIIPAYLSHETIGRCLQSLAEQTYSRLEIIVVDSSPDDRTSSVVSAGHPGVRLARSRERLLPHAARNAGALLASGEYFAFTDPDVYPSPQWLDKLMRAHAERPGGIVGSVACYGSKWIDVGHHLCKYDKWLPGGPPRTIDIGPSANILCSRQVFEQEGGFPPDGMLGDTLLSWRLALHGQSLWFVPTAVVYHHHLGDWSGLLRERFARGAEFGRLRSAYHRWSTLRILSHFVVTALPLRLANLVGRVATNAWRAHQMWDFVRTFPLVLSGEAAWLAGEASAFARLLVRP